MMVHVRKRLSDEDPRRINELLVQRGKHMLLEALEQRSEDDGQDGGASDGCGELLALDEPIKPADWPEDKNWGALTIDATCTPADITYPRGLKRLKEACATTERIIDELCGQSSEFKQHRPRHNREMARTHFPRIAKQKWPHRRTVKAAIKRQLGYVRHNLRAVDALIA
jgi:hypothetical protein